MSLNQLDQVVKILQVGFSGFAFLMAGLSFRLLHAESVRGGAPRKPILGAIERYTKYTVILAILVSISRFGEDWYRSYLDGQRTQALQASSDAQTCRDGLSRLVYADSRAAKEYTSLLLEVQQDVVGCRGVLKWLEEYHVPVE